MKKNSGGLFCVRKVDLNEDINPDYDILKSFRIKERLEANISVKPREINKSKWVNILKGNNLKQCNCPVSKDGAIHNPSSCEMLVLTKMPYTSLVVPALKFSKENIREQRFKEKNSATTVISMSQTNESPDLTSLKWFDG